MTPDDRRAELEATRERLRVLLEDAGPRDAPSLARELRMTLKELADLAAPAKGSKVDELAAKRAARIAGAEGS